jgi:hypothetical protein
MRTHIYLTSQEITAFSTTVCLYMLVSTIVGTSAAVAHVSIRRNTSAYVGIRRHTSLYMLVSTIVGTSAAVAHVSICQHKELDDRSSSSKVLAYVSIRQHTSAYVRIRGVPAAVGSDKEEGASSSPLAPHTSAYVSIRQHTRRTCVSRE